MINWMMLFKELKSGSSLLEGTSQEEVMGEDAEKKGRGQKNPRVLHAKLSSVFFVLQEKRAP